MKSNDEIYWTEDEVIRALSDPNLSHGAKKVILFAYRDRLSIADLERIHRFWKLLNLE